MHVKRAVVSVSDKTGVQSFAKSLSQKGVEIVSTGGTARAISEAGVSVISIRDVTGNAQDAYFSGRMKTISFNFESALLYDRNDPDHTRQAEEIGITPIDLVVCNLYPFELTVAQAGCTFKEAIENIDIGGPCMIRAAAKNCASVAVLTDPSQYDQLLAQLDEHDGATSEAFRQECAAKAFALTARYDQAIEEYFAGQGLAADLSVTGDR